MMHFTLLKYLEYLFAQKKNESENKFCCLIAIPRTLNSNLRLKTIILKCAYFQIKEKPNIIRFPNEQNNTKWHNKLSIELVLRNTKMHLLTNKLPPTCIQAMS